MGALFGSLGGRMELPVFSCLRCQGRNVVIKGANAPMYPKLDVLHHVDRKVAQLQTSCVLLLPIHANTNRECYPFMEQTHPASKCRVQNGLVGSDNYPRKLG